MQPGTRMVLNSVWLLRCGRTIAGAARAWGACTHPRSRAPAAPSTPLPRRNGKHSVLPRSQDATNQQPTHVALVCHPLFPLTRPLPQGTSSLGRPTRERIRVAVRARPLPNLQKETLAWEINSKRWVWVPARMSLLNVHAWHAWCACSRIAPAAHAMGCCPLPAVQGSGSLGLGRAWVAQTPHLPTCGTSQCAAA